jgi:hypothetical protein
MFLCAASSSASSKKASTDPPNIHAYDHLNSFVNELIAYQNTLLASIHTYTAHESTKVSVSGIIVSPPQSLIAASERMRKVAVDAIDMHALDTLCASLHGMA